jgi:hypothetical protein
MCNPTRLAGSPAQSGHHILQAGGLATRWVVASSFSSSVIGGGFSDGGTQRLKERNKEDSFLSYEKEGFMDCTSQVHRVTRRTCIYVVFVREETCKCQIRSYINSIFKTDFTTLIHPT